ncbi:hypothetical protein CI238_08972 [Colletotrichum incanum]|uniref:Uncharacterized protein n=1 Tax=Colletotrichum incanum TaxID=1573173 RepID=A0A167ANV3_COLIC|nr:hypothetical protein CI238_08972 [Colletotrichum incanum]
MFDTDGAGNAGQLENNYEESSGKAEKFCANCGNPDHELADCARVFGRKQKHFYVSGCPMCNKTGHGYSQCNLLPTGGHELIQHHFEWLVRRRQNLPMIRSDFDIWALVLGFPNYKGGYPWSQAFTKRMWFTKNPTICEHQTYHHGKLKTSIVDPSTKSLADVKCRISFEIPDKADYQYLKNNLLAQGNFRHLHYDTLYGAESLSEAQRERLKQATLREKLTLAKIYRAGAISIPELAQQSKGFAEAIGDFLLYGNPRGVADFASLMSLKQQASRRAEEKQTSKPRHKDKPAIASQLHGDFIMEPFALTPLKIRKEIWTALCPRIKCVGGFPFEVPVPPAARLQKHVFDEMKNKENNRSDRRQDMGQLKEKHLANYIHPHVSIGVTKRKLPNGGIVHALVLGLVEHAYALRFSRLGLLQAYDMVVCWASKIDRDGISISLKGAFDGCNKITEDIVAGENRIEEMTELEKQLRRLSPDSSQFDHAVERISEWMERHKAKLISSPEDWDRRLRKWCEKKHNRLGDMGGDLLEQACQQVVEAKTREWKKSKRGIEDASFDDGIDGARPTKRKRKL